MPRTEIQIKELLTFDDVLLVPKYSEVLPTHVDVRSKFSRNIPLGIPNATNNFLYEDRAKVLRELILKNAPIDPEKLVIKQGYFGPGAKYERIEMQFRD
jgi:hypothetical protein